MRGVYELAPLGEPIAAVASRQLDNARTDMLQIPLALLLAENVEHVVDDMEENVVISAEPHRLVGRCRAGDVAIEVGLSLVGYTDEMGKFVCVGGRIIVWTDVTVEGELAEERPHAACHARHRTEP